MHCVSISVGFYGLPADLGQRRAQRGAGDLQQPLERPVELLDQKDCGDRQRTEPFAAKNLNC